MFMATSRPKPNTFKEHRAQRCLTLTWTDMDIWTAHQSRTTSTSPKPLTSKAIGLFRTCDVTCKPWSRLIARRCGRRPRKGAGPGSPGICLGCGVGDEARPGSREVSGIPSSIFLWAS